MNLPPQRDISGLFIKPFHVWLTLIVLQTRNQKETISLLGTANKASQRETVSLFQTLNLRQIKNKFEAFFCQLFNK